MVGESKGGGEQGGRRATLWLVWEREPRANLACVTEASTGRPTARQKTDPDAGKVELLGETGDETRGSLELGALTAE